MNALVSKHFSSSCHLCLLPEPVRVSGRDHRALWSCVAVGQMMNEAHTIASWIALFTMLLYAGASSVPLEIPNLFSTSERTSRGVKELSIHLQSGSPTIAGLATHLSESFSLAFRTTEDTRWDIFSASSSTGRF